MIRTFEHSASPGRLDRLFSPRSVAVIGASDNPLSAGGQPMLYLTEYGFEGKVFPVNPKRETVRGLRCYRSVLDLPEPVDVALVAVAAPLVAGVVRDCGARGIGHAVVLSSGFRERGAEGQAREAELADVARQSGVRIVGPNCMGVLNIPERVHCGFGQGFRVNDYLPGPVAMTTQSGGYGFTLLRNANRAGLGFNRVVSVGNSIDLDSLDFIEHFLECPDIRIVTAFVEGIADGRRLIALGRKALELNKPILIWKVGNTDAGSRAAASHTASLTSSYALFQTAFREGGYVELQDYEDLVDVAKAFLGGMLPEGDRVGLVSGSGGAGVIAADRFTQAGLRLPEYTDETKARLRDIFPPLARPDNPIDLSGETTKDGKSLSNAAARLVLADDNIDMIMLRSGQTTGNLDTTRELVDIRREIGKPVLVATVAEDHQPAKDLLDEAGVPWFLTVGRAANAARALAGFAARKRRFTGIAPPERPFPRQSFAFPEGERFLSEAVSARLLAAYGLPVVAHHLVAPEAIGEMALPAHIGFPVVVKVCSPDLPHKTEADAIRIGVNTPAQLRKAAREVLGNARAHAPEARIEGILVQRMAPGSELIFGGLDDPCFGPVVLFGLGGVLAEALQDVAYRFAPLDARSAQEMLTEIRASRLLLRGYRGARPADLAALADFAVRLGWLMADHGDRIESIDINPVFADGADIQAADALVVLKQGGGGDGH